MAEPLRRAHTIILSAGGDTARDLADELYALAQRIERGEVTQGCIGGSTAGTTYSYIHDPAMTHDRYFEEINKRLSAEKTSHPALC